MKNSTNSNLDNKIAKAAEKVAASNTIRNSSQENTRANTPDQQQNAQTLQLAGNKTPQDQPEFIKQALITIEKKVRNLEKRRIKLEEYRDIQAKGETLNDDQLNAISRYDEVIRTLELARELEKQFIQLANDAMKQQKKQLKKEQIEREEAIKEKLKEANKVIALLNTFTNEEVRNSFLNETNDVTKLDEHEILALDEFRKLVLPANEINHQLESVSLESAEHLFNFLEGKSKQIPMLTTQAGSTALTYADLKKLFERILASNYWKKRTELTIESGPVVIEAKIDEATPSQSGPAVESSIISNQINQFDLNVDAQSCNQKHQHHNEIHPNINNEQMYQQQNTSEDYILVSTTDYSGAENSHNKIGHTSKAFFSTLNPQESVNRNINEFLNRCENNDDGINFLQDSEIQPHEQQQEYKKNNKQNEHEQHGINDSNQLRSDQYQSGFNQSQNFGNYQDFQESNKDNRGVKPQREFHNGQRNNHNNSNSYHQRPRYQEDQRGLRRSGGNGQNNSMLTNSQTRNNGTDRNGGGNNGGYRGNRGPGNSGGNKGEYRASGGSGYQGGPKQSAGNTGAQRFLPKNSENRQPIIEN